MHEVFALVVQLCVAAGLPALIVWLDEQRLDLQGQGRCWPTTSRWSAVVVFGLLCLPVHFVRTRRSLGGLVLGLAWALVVALTVGLLAWACG